MAKLYGSLPKKSKTNAKAVAPCQRVSANGSAYLASLSSKIPFLEKGATSDKQHARNLIDMLEGTLAISQRQLTEARLREHQPDLLIQPPLSNIGLLDFHKGTTTIEIGRAAAKEVIKAIPRF